MLVLARRPLYRGPTNGKLPKDGPVQASTVVIGPLPREAVGASLTLTVLSVSNGVVRLGFEADESIPIVRRELLGSHRGLGPSGEAIERRAARRRDSWDGDGEGR